ncbi:peptidase M16 [Marinithermofilum abyssi]|uniref:Peptidase M16 n=1 Tax=Marinithermofilum abyssi TaxID=1571185 RepID=A0A8J2VDB1_9BACL|nr:pitrilysin family protein [Marinithermofilum abyssi]GGE25094.1 peptidase M16 [Marinithermofilum abyssi]
MIEKHQLGNGVRVVAEKISSVRSIAFGLWIGTGSRQENARNNGISHFLEHMMFKGTKNRTARELAETFDEIGGQVNAFTSKEMTCYYAKVLDQHLNVALDVLADMFFESTFAEEELIKEQKVIVEEIRMVEDTPDDIVHDYLSQAAMSNHPLGFPVLGNVNNVLSFDRQTVVDYRDSHYSPENLVISLAGNLPDDYLQRIEERFGHFQRGARLEEIAKPQYTAGTFIRKKSTEQTHLCLGFPGISIRDPRIYTFILLNNILGGNMSSRLFQQIREDRGLAYSVFSYHSAYRDTGLFTIYAGTAHGQENNVIEIILDNLKQIRENGVTEAELNKGKEQLKGSLMLSLESTNNRMSRLGKNELLLGKHKTLDEIIESVQQVSHQDVLQLAGDIFTQPMSLSLISPEGRVPSVFRRDALV